MHIRKIIGLIELMDSIEVFLIVQENNFKIQYDIVFNRY